MNARLHCLTLPVDDLQASIAFYRDGLGLIWEDKEDHAIFLLEGEMMLMVMPRQLFQGFVEMAEQEPAPSHTSEVIMTYFASSRDEVDTVLERAVDYARSGEAAEEKGWGYSGYLVDPDGHIWEILHNPTLFRDYYEDLDDGLGDL